MKHKYIHEHKYIYIHIYIYIHEHIYELTFSLFLDHNTLLQISKQASSSPQVHVYIINDN
jgi:hypothetical protein